MAWWANPCMHTWPVTRLMLIKLKHVHLYPMFWGWPIGWANAAATGRATWRLTGCQLSTWFGWSTLFVAPGLLLPISRSPFDPGERVGLQIWAINPLNDACIPDKNPQGTVGMAMPEGVVR